MSNLLFDYDAKIGIKVREIRQKQMLTQKQLCARLQVYGCGVTRSALAKIEVGQRHIYSGEIKAFKEVLNVSYEDLFV